jgi:hypothetical protein
MAAQHKPGPRRYTSDGQLLRTGHQIGSVAHQISPDAERDRVQGLNEHTAHQLSLDESDKDLTLKFREAFDGLSAGAGATNILEEAEGEFTAGIMAGKARAAAVVEDAKLTRSERQAKATAAALADVLTERGLVSEQGSPEVDEPDLTDDDEPELLADGEYGQAENGQLMQVVDGRWQPVDLSADAELEEEDPPDAWPNYVANNEQFVDMADYPEEEEENLDDAA